MVSEQCSRRNLLFRMICHATARRERIRTAVFEAKVHTSLHAVIANLHQNVVRNQQREPINNHVLVRTSVILIVSNTVLP